MPARLRIEHFFRALERRLYGIVADSLGGVRQDGNSMTTNLQEFNKAEWRDIAARLRPAEFEAAWLEFTGLKDRKSLQ